MAKRRRTTLKQKLDFLTKCSENSGEGEFKDLMTFLNDQYTDCHGEENFELFKAICDQFIETATYIKKELASCQQ
jgi:hypothetical protein